MTDEEKAEEYVKNEICLKNCPICITGKCLFEIDKCHYTRQRYKAHLDGLTEGRKGEAYLIDKLNIQNQRLKKENEYLKSVIADLLDNGEMARQKALDVLSKK